MLPIWLGGLTNLREYVVKVKGALFRCRVFGAKNCASPAFRTRRRGSKKKCYSSDASGGVDDEHRAAGFFEHALYGLSEVQAITASAEIGTENDQVDAADFDLADDRVGGVL